MRFSNGCRLNFLGDYLISLLCKFSNAPSFWNVRLCKEVILRFQNFERNNFEVSKHQIKLLNFLSYDFFTVHFQSEILWNKHYCKVYRRVILRFSNGFCLNFHVYNSLLFLSTANFQMRSQSEMLWIKGLQGEPFWGFKLGTPSEKNFKGSNWSDINSPLLQNTMDKRFTKDSFWGFQMASASTFKFMVSVWSDHDGDICKNDVQMWWWGLCEAQF